MEKSLIAQYHVVDANEMIETSKCISIQDNINYNQLKKIVAG